MIKFNLSGPIGRPFHSLIRPKGKVPNRVYEVHEISNDMLKRKPTPAQLKSKVRGYMRNCLLVMHNGRFDGRFLRRYFKIGKRPYIETIELSKKLWPRARKHRLVTICRKLGIRYNPHEALCDAEATKHILIRFFRKFRRFKRLKVKDLEEEGYVKYLR